MLHGPGRLQPDPFLGIVVVEEEPVLVRVAKTLDLRETLADVSAGVQHQGLEKNKKRGVRWSISVVRGDVSRVARARFYKRRDRGI